MQASAVGARRDGHAQGLLAPAQGAVVGYRPIEPGQPQQALGQTCGLAQPQAKHALERQAELDRGVTEDGWPSVPAGRRCLPLQVCIEPDHQGSPAFEGGVVLGPVRRAVLRPRRLAHGLSLPRTRVAPRSRPTYATTPIDAFLL